MKTKMYFLRLVVIAVTIILPAQMINIQAQESEYKDTPWFSGMPDYLLFEFIQ